MQNNECNNTIDCIFDINGTHVVLIKRGRGPFTGYWALPGGRQGVGEELEDTVIREMNEETGIGMKKLDDGLIKRVDVLGQEAYLDQIHTYHSGKDPRGGNTTVYAVQLEMDPEYVKKQIQNGDDAEDIMVCRIDDLPDLAFDHFKFLEDYFTQLKQYKNPTPAIDAIVEYDSKFVYVDRGGKPIGLALPGGFAKEGKSYEQTGIEEIKEETNLDIKNLQLVGVYSDPKRDPRKHITSTVYYAKGQGELRFGDDAKGGGTFTLEDIPAMKFDHNRILDDFAERYNRGEFRQ
ncbi:NUDIX hydrolase [Candidatus Woesearchaeota archaeon]|nr:NUDIX hydrolase [Candidatus Woesearchaeota archaeon]